MISYEGREGGDPELSGSESMSEKVDRVEDKWRSGVSIACLILLSGYL